MSVVGSCFGPGVEPSHPSFEKGSVHELANVQKNCPSRKNIVLLFFCLFVFDKKGEGEIEKGLKEVRRG
jgi:hypothetical protein